MDSNLRLVSVPEGPDGLPPPAEKTERRVVPTSITKAILVSDLLMIVIAVSAGLIAGWGKGASLEQDHPRQFFAAALLLVWPLALWQAQSRNRRILGSGGEEYRRVLTASFGTLVAVAALAYFTDTIRARVFLLGTWLFGVVLLVMGRWIMRGSLQRTMNAGFPLHRVFVIAPSGSISELRRELGESDNRFVEVGCLVVTADVPIAEPEVVVSAAVSSGADTVLHVPFPDSSPDWTRRLGWGLEETDLALLVSPSLVEVAGPRLRVEPVQGLSFVSVEKPKFSGPARVVKRLLDIVGALLGLVLFALPMAVVALVIKIDSRGPVLFKQERMGQDGRTFRCLKFRTMECGASELLADMREMSAESGATFKMPADPRVTRAGRILRKASLDELPQLVNVLVNDMSLVGPRPHQLADVQRYDKTASRRLLAKPGMTGLWQVSGRSDTTWDENVHYDLYYVENWSLSMDIVILFRTIKVVVTGLGAY